VTDLFFAVLLVVVILLAGNIFFAYQILSFMVVYLCGLFYKFLIALFYLSNDSIVFSIIKFF